MGNLLAINGQVINSQEPLPIPVDYDYLGETTGSTEIEIPEGYDDVYCDILDISSNTYYNTSFIADFDSRNRRGGYYFNASNYGGWIIGWDSSTRKAKLLNALSVGHDYTSTAKVKWYAMKHVVSQKENDSWKEIIPTNFIPTALNTDISQTFSQLIGAKEIVIFIGSLQCHLYSGIDNPSYNTMAQAEVGRTNSPYEQANRIRWDYATGAITIAQIAKGSGASFYAVTRIIYR